MDCGDDYVYADDSSDNESHSGQSIQIQIATRRGVSDFLTEVTLTDDELGDDKEFDPKKSLIRLHRELQQQLEKKKIHGISHEVQERLLEHTKIVKGESPKFAFCKNLIGDDGRRNLPLRPSTFRRALQDENERGDNTVIIRATFFQYYHPELKPGYSGVNTHGGFTSEEDDDDQETTSVTKSANDDTPTIKWHGKNIDTSKWTPEERKNILGIEEKGSSSAEQDKPETRVLDGTKPRPKYIPSQGLSNGTEDMSLEVYEKLLEEEIDVKEYKRSTNLPKRKDSEPLGSWYIRFVMHSAQYGVFVPPAESLVKSNPMGSWWRELSYHHSKKE